jgi:hypothetical protein
MAASTASSARHLDVSTEEETDEADDETPLAIIARLSDIAKHADPAMVKAYGDRPIWFILGMDAELVTLFERIPEDPMPKGRVEAILRAVRSFAAEHNEELQAVLGVTDSIEFGFHIDAPVAKVRASFEEDGFFVVGTIEEGAIKVEAVEE